MPLGWGTSASFSTSDTTAARNYTRLRGPVLLGAQNDLVNAGAGASLTPPHIMNVSTARAFFNINAGQGIESSASTVVYGYTPVWVSTYSLSSSGGTSSGPAPTFPTAFTGAMVYDMVTSRLCIYSTSVGEWRSVGLSSS